ncbi:hypothetical protein SAMD00019534_069010, partial [Acytostelium subglobosum LB1]|uniref:hypothetical protein n=1 Tax=Acytostelium subglobosum LB1 TaxID=1410327 RepID=UPI0006450E9E
MIKLPAVWQPDHPLTKMHAQQQHPQVMFTYFQKQPTSNSFGNSVVQSTNCYIIPFLITGHHYNVLIGHQQSKAVFHISNVEHQSTTTSVDFNLRPLFSVFR